MWTTKQYTYIKVWKNVKLISFPTKCDWMNNIINNNNHTEKYTKNKTLILLVAMSILLFNTTKMGMLMRNKLHWCWLTRYFSDMYKIENWFDTWIYHDENTHDI